MGVTRSSRHFQIAVELNETCARAMHDSPWRLEDAVSLARHANNRKIWLCVRDLFPHPYTIQDAHEFLQRAISEQPAMKFCIEVDGTAVGGIGVHPGLDVHRHTATVGYWLGEEFWGRGIMTEAVTAVTDFSFDSFPLRRICAEVFANNPVSARVLEKAGFAFEGRLKNNVMKDGQVLDSLIYARTNKSSACLRLASLLITGDMARLANK